MTRGYPYATHTTVQLTVTAGHEAYVRAAGELDIATADRLADALDAAALCASSIHLDLEHVRFMDARTVGVLARQDRVCRRAGGSLRLHNATGEPRRVLQLCGLENLLG
jgi:anti-sigma B factor antagonist